MQQKLLHFSEMEILITSHNESMRRKEKRTVKQGRIHGDQSRVRVGRGSDKKGFSSNRPGAVMANKAGYTTIESRTVGQEQ